MALMVVPVVVMIALPPATLGSFSASKKATFSAGYWTRFGTFDAKSPITLFLVAAAQTTQEGNRLLADRAGGAVDFVGFVDRRADTPADEFLLTRFVITCCTADAAIVQVRVVGVTPGAFATDAWVDVKGQIYPVGTEILVVASSVSATQQPSPPYLTP